MKKILLFSFSLLGILIFSQRRLYDPAIVAQEKRQVYAGWGDWRPNPKYILGIQTNFAYATVWGKWAPRRNRQYKNGADIRPLKADGLQWQRYAQISLMENQSEQMLQQVNVQKQMEQEEFLNKSHISAVADPLYLVYYKPNLKSLERWNINSPFYPDWGFTNKKAFENAQRFGMIEQFKADILELKDKYEVAKGVDVGRGQRLLMYHDVFLQWRRLRQRIKDTEKAFYLTDITKSKLKQYQIDTAPTHTRSDAEIFDDVLKNAKIY